MSDKENGKKEEINGNLDLEQKLNCMQVDDKADEEDQDEDEMIKMLGIAKEVYKAKMEIARIVSKFNERALENEPIPFKKYN